MPRLFLAFTDDQDGHTPAVEWLVRGDDQTVSASGLAPAEDLADVLAREAPWADDPAKVVVFVPASEAVALSCTVPGRNANQIRRAAPYAIEEYVTGDIEAMHVACGPIQRNQPVRCLVALQTQMADWLALLEDAGATPGFMTADAMALPVAANQASVLYCPQAALIRTEAQTASVDLPNLVVALAGLCAELGEGEGAELDESDAPTLLQINGDLGDLGLSETGFDPLHVQTVQIGESPLQALAECVDDSDAVNLLQGAYAAKRGAAGNWRRWRAVAAGVLAWGALALVLFAAQGFWAAGKADALRSEANGIYREVYEVQRVPGNPARRMRQRLGQGPAAVSDFHRLAAIFGDALGALTKAHELLGLSYSERGGFGAEVVVADYDALEEVRAAFSGRGMELVVVSAEQHESRVRANLRISTGG